MCDAYTECLYSWNAFRFFCHDLICIYQRVSAYYVCLSCLFCACALVCASHPRMRALRTAYTMEKNLGILLKKEERSEDLGRGLPIRRKHRTEADHAQARERERGEMFVAVSDARTIGSVCVVLHLHCRPRRAPNPNRRQDPDSRSQILPRVHAAVRRSHFFCHFSNKTATQRLNNRKAILALAFKTYLLICSWVLSGYNVCATFDRKSHPFRAAATRVDIFCEDRIPGASQLIFCSELKGWFRPWRINQADVRG